MVKSRFTVREHFCCVPPHHARESSKLSHAHGSRIHRREQPHDIRRLKPAREQLFHHGFRFSLRENVSGFRAIDQRFRHLDFGALQRNLAPF